MTKQFEDIVVVIPGITGSALAKPDGERWSLTGSTIARAIRTLGTSVFDLKLHDDDHTLDVAPDGVQATALLNDLHLLPGLWRVDGYSQLEKRLRKRLKLVPGENLRLFPYDWRRDNRAAARMLAEQSQVWLDEQRARGAVDPGLILVCHSMGGLVARYFLEVLQGWKHTRRLVTFGTPYRGSLKAVDALSNGIKASFVELSAVTEMARSFPSVHQLLPIYPSVDLGDGAGLQRVHELAEGLPRTNPAMVADAHRFHTEISTAQASNAQLADYHDLGYAVHPIVGMEQTTHQSGQLNGDRFDMLDNHLGQDLKGDGTVPFVSAFPPEWTDAADAIFLATKHASLHNRPDGLAQIEGIIRGSSVDLSAFRSIENWLALDNGDLYQTGDIEIIVRGNGAIAPTVMLEPHGDEQAVAITGEVVGAVSSNGDQRHRVAFRSVPVGAWQICAETPTARITDSLIVID